MGGAWKTSGSTNRGGTPASCDGGDAMRMGSNHDPLDLIEADLIAPAIVELRRARRGTVCHRGGLFQGAPVLQVGGDPCRPEAVVGELGFNPSRGGAPPNHRIGVRLWEHRAGQLAGAAAD